MKTLCKILTGIAGVAIISGLLAVERNVETREINKVYNQISQVRGYLQVGNFGEANLVKEDAESTLGFYQKSDRLFISDESLRNARLKLEEAWKTKSTNDWDYSATYPPVKKSK
ncbi:MAG: hypothetical protein AABX85_00110 [Nanoarchaeota archaeon]